MEKELRRNEFAGYIKTERDAALDTLKEGIVAYINEIEGLLEQVNSLKSQKEEFFKEFEDGLPTCVKEGRSSQYKNLER